MRDATASVVAPSSATKRLDPNDVVKFAEHVDLLYEVWTSERRRHPRANSVISNARAVSGRIAEVLDGTGSTASRSILGRDDVAEDPAAFLLVVAELSVLRIVALEWLRSLASGDRLAELERRINDAVDTAVLAVSPKLVSNDEGAFGVSRTESMERVARDRDVQRSVSDSLADDAPSLAGGSASEGLVARDVDRLTGRFRDDVRSRFVVEQAKGVIAQRFGIPIDRALMVLHEFAQDQNASVVEIANRLVARSLSVDDLHVRVPGAEAETAATVTDRERMVSDLHNTIVGRLLVAGLNLHTAISGADEPTRERLQITVDGLDQTIKDIHVVELALRQSSGTPGTTPVGRSRRVGALDTRASGSRHDRPVA